MNLCVRGFAAKQNAMSPRGSMPLGEALSFAAPARHTEVTPMPGEWSPEHRAAYEETMRRRREARASGALPSARVRSDHKHHKRHAGRGCNTCDEIAGYRPVGDVLEQARAAAAEFEEAQQRVATVIATDPAPLMEAIRRLSDSVAVEAQSLRATLLRVENRVLVAADRPDRPVTPDPRLIAAIRTLERRLARVEAAVAHEREWDVAAMKLLARIDSRPPRIIEYRTDHRRMADGGTPVRVQRREVGLPKRRKDGRAP